MSSPDADCLFRAPLVDSIDAEYAAGSPTGTVDEDATPPTFEDDGVRPGARFARDTCVYYEVADNFRREAGTVMLWFKPDWDAHFEDDLGRILWDLRLETFHHGEDRPDPSQRWALVYPSPKGHEIGRPPETLDRWRFCVATDRNAYLIGTTELRPDERSRQAVFGTEQCFDAGDWLHLAATWTPTEGAIFVDGKEDARSELAEGLPDRPLPEHMQLGALASWMNAGAEGVLADFRLYGEALKESAIAGAAGL